MRRLPGSEVEPGAALAYRRGAIMGLTMAEAFVLIAFILLLLLAAWKAQTDAEREVIEGLSHETLAALARVEQAGKTDKFMEFKDNPDDWRLIDKDELRRVIDKSTDFPEDMQSDLADLVEIMTPYDLARILEETRRAPENASLSSRLAGIGSEFRQAEAQRQGLVNALISELSDEVEQVGGSINGFGEIVLPEGVAFEAGSDEIRPAMYRFLGLICEPWLKVLMSSPAPVREARIEGHASSEWRGAGADQAYVNNLLLSQRRAARVLEACLGIIRNREVIDWAHQYLSAVGYSSGRPVLVDGEEDRLKSRRVVFSLEIDDSRLLESVRQQVQQGLDGGQ